MKHLLIAILATFFAITIIGCSGGVYPPKPDNHTYMVDTARMFDNKAHDTIQKLGERLDKELNIQLVVVTIPSRGATPIPIDISTELAHKWGMDHNGVLLFISKRDEEYRIKVGHNLKGVITDVYAKEQLNSLSKYFRSKRFSKGITVTYTNLVSQIYKSYNEEEPVVEESQDTFLRLLAILFLILILSEGVQEW